MERNDVYVTPTMDCTLGTSTGRETVFRAGVVYKVSNPNRYNSLRTVTGDDGAEHLIRVRNDDKCAWLPKGGRWIVLRNVPVENDARAEVGAEIASRPHGPQEYKGNGQHSWEVVVPAGRTTGQTMRLRVPGGWVYRYGVNGAPVFVPMPAVVGYPI